MELLFWQLFAVLLAAARCQFISSSNYHNKTKVSFQDCYESSNDESVWDYSFNDLITDQQINLSQYKNTTLLIVNVATY